MSERVEHMAAAQEMERRADEMTTVHLLTAENALFAATEGGFVSLDHGGEHYDRVALIRMFPFTDPDCYISVREWDERGREIGIIERLSDWDAETVSLIDGQMRLRYFTPKITAVHSVKAKYGFANFDVETDCGRVKFSIRNGGDAVAHLSENRIIFIDVSGNRFELPDFSRLSAAEQKKIDVYI